MNKILSGGDDIFICDMHCDSLTAGESGSLLRSYNQPEKTPWLISFAHFVRNGGMPPDCRRRLLVRLHRRYRRLVSRRGITQIFSADDISGGGMHALFTIEGGGGLFADSPELAELYEDGLRVLGMAWDKNELSASARESGREDYGLTDEGRRLALRSCEMGITLDTSHMSDRAFFDLASLIDAPFVATHSNFRSVCESGRNLTDDMALEIGRRGGLIGINLYPPFLKSGGGADACDIIRQVDFGLSLVGEDSLAFGLDIDGTGGEYPDGFGEGESIHDGLVSLLLRYYSDATVRKIAGENFIRYLKTNL